MRVGLMADIPDQSIIRGIEDIVHRRGQFDHAKTGAEMAAGLADRGDHFGAQFIGQLAQLRGLKLAKVVGSFDGIEQRRNQCGHKTVLH